MKPDYKNWVPKGLLYVLLSGAIASLVLFIVFCGVTLSNVALKISLIIIFLLSTIIFTVIFAFMLNMYKAFDYNGKRKMSAKIVNAIANEVKIPSGGTGLDVGCGSGALTIACAKRNLSAKMVGVDRWGKEYASYNKPLCENNAKAEGVNNVSFKQGDAANLNFEDESFDAVVSNYVYHNIPSKKLQEVILETLRVLKKGGIFVIHDIFSKSKYGDMDLFIENLKKQGYSKVSLIDTTNGKFISKKDALLLGLSGSALLIGKK